VELKHAKIEVLDKDAYRPNGPLDKFFEVQFNPTEYTRSKGAQIAEIGIYGIDSPILQFIRGQNEKLTLDLFFDTTTLGGMGENAVSVTTKTEPFYQLCKIQPKTHAPPRIRFTWSEALSFKAIVESVQQKFTLFNPRGIPLRATLSVSFREYKTLEEQLAQLKLESVDHTKRYVVQRGDTLDANADIANPRRLTPGQVLIIPPLTVFSRPLVDGQ
jgi:hypothetical protein